MVMAITASFFHATQDRLRCQIILDASLYLWLPACRYLAADAEWSAVAVCFRSGMHCVCALLCKRYILGISPLLVNTTTASSMWITIRLHSRNMYTISKLALALALDGY